MEWSLAVLLIVILIICCVAIAVGVVCAVLIRSNDRNRGTQGNEGIQGLLNSAGFDGFSAKIGSIGFRGAQGLFGFTGAQGLANTSPASTLVGHQGAQTIAQRGFQGGSIANGGAQGLMGAQGLAGFQMDGFQGLNGAQGIAGNDGTNSANGTQGAAGTQGLVGVLGAQGYFGRVALVAIGAQGFMGFVGAQGNTGPQGNVGAQGLVGNFVQGMQGATSSQPRGVQGYTGVQGADGAQGPTSFVAGPANIVFGPVVPYSTMGFSGSLAANPDVNTFFLEVPFRFNQTQTFRWINVISGRVVVGGTADEEIYGITYTLTYGPDELYKAYDEVRYTTSTTPADIGTSFAMCVPHTEYIIDQQDTFYVLRFEFTRQTLDGSATDTLQSARVNGLHIYQIRVTT